MSDGSLKACSAVACLPLGHVVHVDCSSHLQNQNLQAAVLWSFDHESCSTCSWSDSQEGRLSAEIAACMQSLCLCQGHFTWRTSRTDFSEVSSFLSVSLMASAALCCCITWNQQCTPCSWLHMHMSGLHYHSRAESANCVQKCTGPSSMGSQRREVLQGQTCLHQLQMNMLG